METKPQVAKKYFNLNSYDDKPIYALFFNEAINNLFLIFTELERKLYPNSLKSEKINDLNYFLPRTKDEISKMRKSKELKIIEVLLSDNNELLKERIKNTLEFELPWFNSMISDSDTERIAHRLQAYIVKLFDLRNYYSHALKDILKVNSFSYSSFNYHENSNQHDFQHVDNIQKELMNEIQYDRITYNPKWEKNLVNFNEDLKTVYKGAKKVVKERFDVTLPDSRISLFKSGKEKIEIEGKSINKALDQLNTVGICFFLSLFLTKDRANYLISHVYGLKNTSTENNYLNVRRCFLVLNAKPPKPKFVSMDAKTALVLDILNNLNRLPKFLEPYLKEDVKDQFRVIPKNFDDDELEVWMVRHQNRFNEFALELMEYAGLFQNCKTMLKLGKVYTKEPYPKQIADENVERRLLKSIIAFAELKEVKKENPYQEYIEITDNEEEIYNYPLFSYYPKYSFKGNKENTMLGIKLRKDSYIPDIKNKNAKSYLKELDVITDKYNIPWMLFLSFYNEDNKGEIVSNKLKNWKNEFNAFIKLVKDNKLKYEIRSNKNGETYAHFLNAEISHKYIPNRIRKYYAEKELQVSAKIKDILHQLKSETNSLEEDNYIVSKKLVPKNEKKNEKKKEKANKEFKEELEKQRILPNFKTRGEKAMWLAKDIQFWMRPKPYKSEGDKQNFQKLNSDAFAILQQKLALMHNNYSEIKEYMGAVGLFDKEFGHPFLAKVETLQGKKDENIKIEHLFLPYLKARKKHIDQLDRGISKNTPIREESFTKEYYFIRNKELKRWAEFKGKREEEFKNYLNNLAKEPVFVHPHQWRDRCKEVSGSEHNYLLGIIQDSNKIQDKTVPNYYKENKYNFAIGSYPIKDKYIPAKNNNVEYEERLQLFWNYQNQQAQDILLWNLLPKVLGEENTLAQALKKIKLRDIQSKVLEEQVETGIYVNDLDITIRTKAKVKDMGKIYKHLKNPQLYTSFKNKNSGLLCYFKKGSTLAYQTIEREIAEWNAYYLSPILKMFFEIETYYQDNNKEAYKKAIEDNPEGAYLKFSKIIEFLKLNQELDYIRNAFLHGSIYHISSEQFSESSGLGIAEQVYNALKTKIVKLTEADEELCKRIKVIDRN